MPFLLGTDALSALRFKKGTLSGAFIFVALGAKDGRVIGDDVKGLSDLKAVGTRRRTTLRDSLLASDACAASVWSSFYIFEVGLAPPLRAWVACTPKELTDGDDSCVCCRLEATRATASAPAFMRSCRVVWLLLLCRMRST